MFSGTGTGTGTGRSYVTVLPVFLQYTRTFQLGIIYVLILLYQVEDVPGRSYGCRINRANMMYEYLVHSMIDCIHAGPVLVSIGRSNSANSMASLNSQNHVVFLELCRSS